MTKFVGNILRRSILVPDGLTVGQAAERIGIHRVNLSKILNGRTKLSPWVALAMERAFDVNLRHLLHSQLNEQIDQAERAHAKNG